MISQKKCQKKVKNSKKIYKVKQNKMPHKIINMNNQQKVIDKVKIRLPVIENL